MAAVSYQMQDWETYRYNGNCISVCQQELQACATGRDLVLAMPCQITNTPMDFDASLAFCPDPPEQAE